jgi:hypothetical protein
MHLAQGENGLSIRLLVERDQHPELARVIVLVGAVIDFEQARPVDAQEGHSIVVARPPADHVKPPHAAFGGCSPWGLFWQTAG